MTTTLHRAGRTVVLLAALVLATAAALSLGLAVAWLTGSTLSPTMIVLSAR